MPLFDWQEPICQGVVRALSDYGFCVNASDCGTGKTYIALEATKRMGRKALVWCPKSVIDSWRVVASQLEAPVLDIRNPEQYRLGKTPWFHGNRWHVPADTVLVVDEIHRGASGIKSQQTNIVALSKAWNVPVLAQSATVADSPLKMRAIGFLAGLHDFNTASFYRWCRNSGCYDSRFHNGLDFPSGKRGVELMKKVHEQMRHVLVRARIQDIEGFPESSVQPMLLTLPARETAEFKAAYAELDERLKKPGANEMVEVLRARQRTELLKAPYLKEDIDDAIEQGNSVVVLVQFRDTLDVFKGLYPEAAVIVGDQGKEDRDKEIARFQNHETFVVVGTAAAGGLGVNLHDVNHVRPRVAFITPGWSASEFLQCTGRVWRAGASRSIQHVVLAAGTAEERVYKKLINKQRCITSLQDGDLM